tara:strand:- start:958 stop:1536 length:579 start_codon:yes stop_codon:yes gene_type:complete
LLTPGCVNPNTLEITEDTVDSEDTVDNSIPEFLNLIAETAGRDVDRGDEMDILLDANGEKTMILWVSTGCSGCHDWTEFIANHMRDGNISNDTRIITVHRYPSFETREEVIDVYATSNKTTESLWPVVIPVKDQPAIDVVRNNETEMSYSAAFENPATPSLTILDGEGKTVWKNKTYWANQSVLDEAIGILS